MTTKKVDTLSLDSDVPLPVDRRGQAERLPADVKSTIESMSIGQSFQIDANEDNATRRVGAIRAMIQRCVNRRYSPTQFFYNFSVRVQKDPETEAVTGVRVWRLDDSDTSSE
jgi:hypothetical protein|tara:strand:- start:5120 stop:5455 length:336 start_codon:yes stop_codon:yes gene_type:complete